MAGKDRKTGGTAGNRFWDFSLAVYGHGEVAAACLALQDRHGVDVNVLLFCAWAGSRGHVLRAGELADLMAAARPWQETVIAPLRAVRRRLKAMAAAPESAIDRLREQVKGAELAAESVQQRLLFERLAIAAGDGAPGLAGGNMIAYLTALGIAADAVDLVDLAAVLRGCYPDLSPLQAVWAVAD
ncbi:MAG TPA: TIGR02444 family protein [Kiloniellales bacterium]